MISQRVPMTSGGPLRGRETAVDIARALALLLVLLHHLVQYFLGYGTHLMPHSVAVVIVQCVTWVHIPTFMVLSGYCQALSDNRRHYDQAPAEAARRKFERLMLPYLSICLIQLVVRIGSRGTQVSEVPRSLTMAMIAPHAGPAPHGWFVYTLLWMSLIWLVFRAWRGRHLRQRDFALFFLGWLIVGTLPIAWPRYNSLSYYFELQRLAWYFPMVILGYWLGARKRSVLQRLRAGLASKGVIVALAGAAASVFVLTFLLRYRLQDAGSICRPCPGAPVVSFLLNIARWCGSMCAVSSVVGVSVYLARRAGFLGNLLSRLGSYSYEVYLLHVLCAHFLMHLLVRLHLSVPLVQLAFLPTFAATVILALAAGRLVRRMPLFSFLMLGLPGEPKMSGTCFGVRRPSIAQSGLVIRRNLNPGMTGRLGHWDSAVRPGQS